MCPECGLRFEWNDVLGNARPPTWWVEHPVSGGPRRIPGTLLRTLRPFKLWRTLRMEFDGRLAQAALVFVFAVAMVSLAGLAFLTTILFQTYQDNQWDPRRRMPWEELLRPRFLWEYRGPLYVLLFASLLALAMAVLPETRRRARVAARHIVRVAIYAACAGLLVMVVGLLCAIGISLVGERIRASRPFTWNQLSRASARAFSIGAFSSYVIIAASWIVACRSFLRLERPMAVAASIIAIASIATFTAAVCIWLIDFYGWRHALFG